MDRWQAVGLSAMLPTLVLTDGVGAAATPGGIDAHSSRRSLEPLGPAITWEDGRAEAEGSAFREGFGGDALYRRTGQWVDGRYLVPMALRLAAREPERVGAARYLLGAKDYLFGVLTGEALTDPSTATGTGCYDLADGAWIAEAAPSGLPRLPEIAPCTTARPLRPAAARTLGLVAGTPVVLGGADSVLGALGLGLASPGQVAYIAGTSTVILALDRHAGARRRPPLPGHADGEPGQLGARDGPAGDRKRARVAGRAAGRRRPGGAGQARG